MSDKIDLPALAFNEEEGVVTITSPEFVPNVDKHIFVKESLYSVFCSALNPLKDKKEEEVLKTREISGVKIEFFNNGVVFSQGKKQLAWSIEQVENFLLGVEKGVYTVEGLQKHAEDIYKELSPTAKKLGLKDDQVSVLTIIKS